MSNSDSEAFESADEDFEEQKANKGYFINIYFVIYSDP